MMHYLFLWNIPILRELSVTKKRQIIKSSIELFKREKSVDMQGRYFIIAILALLPAIIIFVNFTLTFALIMFLINSAMLEWFLAKSEAPFIREIIETEFEALA